MPERRSAKKKGPRAVKHVSKTKPARTTSRDKRGVLHRNFPKAFGALLKSRGLAVPRGLLAAPPEAYARAPGEFVETLAKLGDRDLLAHAEKIATYADRLADRAKASWESSPLIGEIRRRKLKEPPRPDRLVALAFSLKKPLSEWSDRELLQAAKEWSRRGR